MSDRFTALFQSIIALLNGLFLQQRRVIDTEARNIAVLTPRRAGKTLLACTAILAHAMSSQDGRYLYLALTRPSAKRIAWNIFKKLNRIYKLGCYFKEGELTIVAPTGSEIYLLGADQVNWVERLYGLYLDIAVIDEAASFQIDIGKVIRDVIRPSVADRRGKVILIGTPQDNINCFFYDVTRPEVDKREPGWEVHTWTTFDNPHMKEQWEEEIEELRAKNPTIELTPGFRRHYLGQWVVERVNSVYLFDRAQNLVREAPAPHPEDRFTLGLDFGWDDAQAFAIGLYNPTYPVFYGLEAYKEKNMTLDRCAQRVVAYQQKYPRLRIVGDPARKQLMMELVVRFRLPVEVAEKTEKQAVIELYNTDLILGRIKYVESACQPLIQEQENLVKQFENSDGTGKWKEHPRQPNDCCDTMLYAWRDARHFLWQEKPKQPEKGTPEYSNMIAERMLEQELEQYRKKKGRDWWRRS